ncbi:MAG: hypothetical protein KIT72_07180 [Polyangiaceae bacterium]|nr:hypothetical protein [Polyangiaceae bacterium]MCW5790186.1 hypothetical protein [Polyangiaceae bacterium]
MERRRRLVNGVMDWVTEQARARRTEARVTALDEARLLEQHERVVEASERASSLLGGAGARATQQRSALDGLRDYLRRSGEREKELRQGALPVKEAFERLKIIALNAGLAGARLGEPAGTPLLLVAEEVRALVERGLEATEAHAGRISELEPEREAARAELDQAQQHALTIANELLGAQSAQRQAAEEVAALGKQIQRVTGTDPELARTLTEAAQHAEGLLAALSQLSARAPRGGVFEPLIPLVGELRTALRKLSGGS